jgi:hypothetical protein
MEWAQGIARLLRGVEVMRALHRFFAVVTFGYAVVHVVWLIRNRRSKALRGSESLMPRRKDLADLAANVRWFLYLGPPPKMTKWTYLEKFDYFAVFWGVAVIGISGLMLGFPKLVGGLVSGEALNLAAIVHGKEALLAATFIFIFHSFRNHCRIDVFPIDASIFTGRITLERFRIDRPGQYEALEKEGHLEEVLVDPPSRAVLLASWIFGIGALLVGFLLVAGILGSWV